MVMLPRIRTQLNFVQANFFKMFSFSIVQKTSVRVCGNIEQLWIKSIYDIVEIRENEGLAPGEYDMGKPHFIL